MATALDLASTLSRYQPSTQGSIRRSQYLQDALEAMAQSGQKDPQSLAEALSRVGQTALLKRGQDRASAELAKALAGEKAAANAPTLDWLKGMQPSEAAPPAASAPQPTPPQTPPAPQLAPQQLAPQNRSNGTSPVGIRQNNPGNIRDTQIPWQGAVGAQGGFEQFDTPQNGLRALARNLQTYGKNGINTVEQIVGRWAPPSENNTAAYVGAVAQRLGVDPRQPLDMSNPEVLAALSGAIIQHENGQNPFGPDQIMGGVQAAMGGGAAPPPQQAQVPQAAPLGPQVQAPGQPPQQPAQQPPGRRPTPEQLAIVNDLLSNPQTYDKGLAFAQQLRMDYAAPPKNDVQVINGVPTLIDPVTGRMTTLQIPEQARNQMVGPADLGISAPPGTMFQQSPTGDTKQVYAPPSGQQVASQPGGQYREAPIQGGANDPLSPSNKLQAFQSFRGELKPILDAATSLRRNVDAVRTGYRQQNGSGDIAMVNGLQKLIDEGVVREGDVALQLKGQGLEGGLAGIMGMLQSQGFFNPEIRAKIQNTANELYGALNSTYRQRAEGYRGIVEADYGPGSFSRVVPPETMQALGWSGQQAAMPTPQAGQLQPPIPGAQRGGDGAWYAQDPTKKGSFPRVQQDERGWYVRGSDGQKYHWTP